jgi:hypothetical protein
MCGALWVSRKSWLPFILMQYFRSCFRRFTFLPILLYPCVCIRTRLTNWRVSDEAVPSQHTIESRRVPTTVDANYGHFRRIQISGKLFSCISWLAGFFTSKSCMLRDKSTGQRKWIFPFHRFIIQFIKDHYWRYLWHWLVLSLLFCIREVTVSDLTPGNCYLHWVLSLIFSRSHPGKFWYILKWATILLVSWAFKWTHSVLNYRLPWLRDLIRLYIGKGRDSAVGIATGYMLDGRGVGARVPVGARFFSSPRRPDRF